ncbi:MAG: nucleotidyltransferase family protein [Gammaproteobacteria bacterium]
MPLQAIILAAGSSRRFPGNKLLQQLPGQTCLLDKSYRLASHLTSEVLLVINDDPRLAAYCQAQAYPFIINIQAHTGMASSIVTGVSASPEAEGWAIFLADMPGIKSTTVALLADSWSGHAITVPTWQDKTGHPVIFSHSCYRQLLLLQGDRGARSLLQHHPDVHRVKTDDAGVCLDIDTEKDWQAYLQQ